MNLLKKIPVHYKGELHDVRLINFSVPIEEVQNQVPVNIKVRNFNGRAMISMVDVKLKNMRPVLLPFLNFQYRHVAFRLLVEDRRFNNGVDKGIYFLRSFTDKALIVTGGKLMTDYNLESAVIDENQNEVTIRKGTNVIRYQVNTLPITPDESLKSVIGSLDRAYAALGDVIRVTQIQREKWPIQQVECTAFENTFFKSARLEGAFRVFETIYYDWLPPKPVTL